MKSSESRVSGQDIKRVAYGYLERGPAPPAMQIEAPTVPLKAYLAAHLDHLLDKAVEGYPLAHFRSGAATGALSKLLTPVKAGFTSCASDLASAVHTEFMKKPAATPGFIVAVQAEAAERRIAAIFKLDRAGFAGAREKVVNGSRRLEGILDLLEQPGDIQKGALVPDPRGGSDVLVAERAGTTAAYFLDALDLTETEASERAARQLLRVVSAKRPEDAKRVADAVDALAQPVPVEELLELITDEAGRAAVEQGLPRSPHRRITTIARPPQLLAEIVAGDVRVRGPHTTIAGATIAQNDRGGRTISVDVAAEPRRVYH